MILVLVVRKNLIGNLTDAKSAGYDAANELLQMERPTLFV
jgi:hypothetical protein